MPIQQVRAKVNNVWTILTYNGTTGKYEGTIAAPHKRWTLLSGHH